MANRLAAWLWGQRASARLGFILQIVFRLLTSLLALVWTPLVLNSMGKALNGLFLSFQAVANLGGLGDLGLGGAVNIQTSRLLGKRDEKELLAFLTAARAFFLVLALGVTAGLMAFCTKFPGWLHFATLPEAGSLPVLFAVGAVGAGLLILGSYTANLNYGAANVALMVAPNFVWLQAGLWGHWLLARQHAPLWLQYSPYLLAAAGGIVTGWACVRLSHPPLARLRPLRFDRQRWLSLAQQSFWVYLYYFGAGVCAATARLMINARFGAEIVPAYTYNAKLCELAMFVIFSANVASIPKLTQWLHSPEESQRQRGRGEAEKLNKFQTLLGCGAALGYLAVNDLFMKLWLGPGFDVPLHWQAAFAASMAVTAAGATGFELCSRVNDRSLRFGGSMVALTALLNLGISYLGLRLDSIFLIALATVVSQSVLVLATGWQSCGLFGLSWWRVALKPWLLMGGVVVAGFAIRKFLPLASLSEALLLGIIYLALLGGVAWALGFTRKDIADELRALRGFFGGDKPSPI